MAIPQTLISKSFLPYLALEKVCVRVPQTPRLVDTPKIVKESDSYDIYNSTPGEHSLLRVIKYISRMPSMNDIIFKVECVYRIGVQDSFG